MNTRVNRINQVKAYLKKDIIQASFFTAIATGIKTISAFVAGKIIAVYVGPAGLGLMGQLTNFINIVLPISSFGLNNGITKYVAEYKDNKQQKASILSTALKLTFFASIILGLVIIFGASFWANIILKDNKYVTIFIVFGCTVILYALNNFFLSVINGYKEFKKYNQINIITNIVGLVFTIVLSILYGVYGALLTQVTSQSVIFFITFFYVLRSEWFSKSDFTLSIQKDAVKKLFQYTLMTIVSAIVMPISQILVRNIIIRHISLDAAGYWEAINRISNLYLMLITLSLTTYYLPRLSEISDQKELRKEILTAYKIFMPIIIFISFIIFLFRIYIIQIVFSSSFASMENLFLFQLVGDIFKIAGWLLALQMIAKSLTKQFIITEIVFSISYYLLSLFFIKIYGLQGSVISFAINYFMYFIVMIIVFRKIIFIK